MIILTERQEKEMNDLYKQYSDLRNPDFSLANRSFVYGFTGLSKEDRRIQLLEGIKDKSPIYILTQDCINSVDKILNNP